MSLIAKNEGNVNIEKLEDGVYPAVSSMIIDLGMQRSIIDDKVRRKFMMIWNIVDEFIEVNGEKLPRIITKEYTLSLNEKSNLRKDLQAWRGKPFTSEELEGFDIKNVLNKGCQLQIINEEKNGKTYTNIASIMGLPKGAIVNELSKTTEFYIEDRETWNNLNNVPKWIIEKIKKSENFDGSDLSKFIKELEEMTQNTNTDNTDNKEKVITPDDDLPF